MDNTTVANIQGDIGSTIYAGHTIRQNPLKRAEAFSRVELRLLAIRRGLPHDQKIPVEVNELFTLHEIFDDDGSVRFWILPTAGAGIPRAQAERWLRFYTLEFQLWRPIISWLALQRGQRPVVASPLEQVALHTGCRNCLQSASLAIMCCVDERLWQTDDPDALHRLSRDPTLKTSAPHEVEIMAAAALTLLVATRIPGLARFLPRNRLANVGRLVMLAESQIARSQEALRASAEPSTPFLEAVREVRNILVCGQRAWPGNSSTPRLLSHEEWERAIGTWVAFSNVWVRC